MVSISAWVYVRVCLAIGYMWNICILGMLLFVWFAAFVFMLFSLFFPHYFWIIFQISFCWYKMTRICVCFNCYIVLYMFGVYLSWDVVCNLISIPLFVLHYFVGGGGVSSLFRIFFFFFVIIWSYFSVELYGYYCVILCGS